MSKVIYWIDDAFDGQSLPNELEREEIKEILGADVSPTEPIRNREQFLELVDGIDATNTLGVVMDYQLRQVESGGGNTKGSVWAAEIRFKHPSVPVVGISYEDEERIPDFQLENFLEFFPRTRLAEPDPEYGNLKALFAGYAAVYDNYTASGSKDGSQIIAESVAPPAEITKTLSDAIPSKLRGDWDQEMPHLASRWIWHELQGRPGFLLDRLEVATELGLNERGFGKVEHHFADARYKGAFNSDQRPRWWACRIRPTVSSIFGQRVLGPVAQHREVLLNALEISEDQKAEMLSRPFGTDVSNGIPNCVAYPDEATRDMVKRVQTFRSSTVILDIDAGQPFGFEPRRTFRAIDE